jgi:hypothetical protein
MQELRFLFPTLREDLKGVQQEQDGDRLQIQRDLTQIWKKILRRHRPWSAKFKIGLQFAVYIIKRPRLCKHAVTATDEKFIRRTHRRLKRYWLIWDKIEHLRQHVGKKTAWGRRARALMTLDSRWVAILTF